MTPGSTLDAYEPGDASYVATPRGSLLTRGVRALVPAAGADALADRAEAMLAKTAGALVIGAVGFDATLSHLVVPESVRSSGRAAKAGLPDPGQSDADSADGAEAWPWASIPTADAYEAAVRSALATIGAGEIEKVVLARAIDVTAPGDADVDVTKVLRRLVHADPEAYVYAIDLPVVSRHGHGAGPVARTLVGASPELLVRRSGAMVQSRPMAGSRPRSGDPEADARARADLWASAKDRAEHAYVVDAVAATLAPYCESLDVPRTPELARTPTMWHLATPITGRLRTDAGGGGAASALRLALALHPTPAVCGTPRDAARRVIAAVEGFDREYYAGAVGWCDAAGDGEWAITIRGADVCGRHVRAYAGAGIVAGSDPAAEVAETEAKLRTFLRAL